MSSTQSLIESRAGRGSKRALARPGSLRANLALLGLALSSSAVGCSGSDSDPAPPSDSPAVRMKMVSVVPAKEEEWTCQLFRMPDDPLFVRRISHELGAGSHHILVRRTDLTEIDPTWAEPSPCYEGEGVMLHARGIFYASQARNEELVLPDGVALRTDPGEILVMQTHFQNPSASPITLDATLTFDAIDEHHVEQVASVYAFYAPFIHVPPFEHGAAQIRCPIPTEMNLVSGASHMHLHGREFTAYLDPSADELGEQPFYTSADWEHPSRLSRETLLPAGSNVRIRCEFDNSEGEAEIFQGQSATSNEMCFFAGIYYPEVPLEVQNCAFPDMVGVGKKSCAETLGCIDACPPETSLAATGFGLNNSNVSECWQFCLAESCPRAAGPIFGQLGCIGQNCATECGESPESCGECVAAKCSAQVEACLQSECGSE